VSLAQKPNVTGDETPDFGARAISVHDGAPAVGAVSQRGRPGTRSDLPVRRSVTRVRAHVGDRNAESWHESARRPGMLSCSGVP
jgi:hypothetical protein